VWENTQFALLKHTHSPSLNLSFAEVGANLEIKFDADNDALMRFTFETCGHIFAAQ
jgi:hypothetical protein